MIEPVPNHPDKVWISFDDWTPSMMALASRLNRKPDRPGDDGPRSHEIGIDQLSKLPLGHLAIEALWDISEDWKYCPDHEDVVQRGKAVIKMYMELEVFCEKRRRQKTYLQDRERANAKTKRASEKRVIRFNLPTRKYGIVRGN